MSDEQIGFFTASDTPYGKTYGRWTVEWWRWILGIPKRVNPVVDMSGEYTAVSQQNRDVYFLAGKLAEEQGDLPERYCKISAHKSILVPVINSESNPLENPELRNNKDIVERVKTDENTIVRSTVQCYLDGKFIPPERISSDPTVFEVRLVDDNLFNVRTGGMTRASADGYWTFLKPLPRGEHTISFQGSCEMGRLHSGAIYKVDIE
jgi:hypothetical protein